MNCDFHTHVIHETQPSGFIYFILDIGAQLVKIGYSTNPRKRVRIWLQGGNRVVLKIVPGSKLDEGLFHEIFQETRAQEGEWFAYTDNLKEFMSSLGKTPPSLDDLLVTKSDASRG